MMDIEEANRPGLFEFCGGDVALAECKKDAGTCEKIPDMGIENDATGIGLSANPYSNYPDYFGAGVCVDDKSSAYYNSFVKDLQANLEKSQIIKDGEFKESLNLRKGLTIYWTIFKDPSGRDMIKLGLSNRLGQGWIGMGISPTGGMIGSHVAMGWADDNDAYVGDRTLIGKFPWDIVMSEKQQIVDAEIEKNVYETVLKYTRPLFPDYYGDENDDALAIKPGPNFLVYAIGDVTNRQSYTFGKHRFRDVSYVTFYDNLL